MPAPAAALADDPHARFEDALARARTAQPYEASPLSPSSLDPTAMTLATVDGAGQPAARIVLLKGHDERGFVFYTNRTSKKGQDLAAQAKAALLFFWPLLAEQVRVEGLVELVSDAESDAYFATRPRDSQLGAWASLQSQTLARREELVERLRELEARFAGREVPRPPHWGGYRVLPLRMEFWKEAPYRLHERDVYERNAPGEPWTRRSLYP